VTYLLLCSTVLTSLNTHTPQDSTKPLQLLETVSRPTSPPSPHPPAIVTVWWFNTLLFQSISPGLVKTDFLTSSGSKVLTPETVYSGTPHLLPEDVVETVLFALGCPAHVQVSPRLRSSTQLVCLSEKAFNYHRQCLSERTAQNVNTISIIIAPADVTPSHLYLPPILAKHFRKNQLTVILTSFSSRSSTRLFTKIFSCDFLYISPATFGKIKWSKISISNFQLCLQSIWSQKNIVHIDVIPRIWENVDLFLKIQQ